MSVDHRHRRGLRQRARAAGCLGALAARRACRRSSSTTPRRDGVRADRARCSARRVIRNQRNEGYGRANNIGVARGRDASSSSSSIRMSSSSRAPSRRCSTRRERYPEAGFFAPQHRRAGRARVLPAALAACALSDEPARPARAARGRCLRAVLFGRLLSGAARPVPARSAASTRTSSCSTRTTISAAASPRPALPSSMCRTRRRAARARPLERAEAGAHLPVALAPGLVARLCRAASTACRTRRPAMFAVNAAEDARRVPHVPPARLVERYGGSAAGALAFLRGGRRSAREGPARSRAMSALLAAAPTVAQAMARPHNNFTLLRLLLALAVVRLARLQRHDRRGQGRAARALRRASPSASTR